MRALIIEASGFVGKTLAAHLREKGDSVVESGRSAAGPDVTNRTAIHDLVAVTTEHAIRRERRRTTGLRYSP